MEARRARFDLFLMEQVNSKQTRFLSSGISSLSLTYSFNKKLLITRLFPLITSSSSSDVFASMMFSTIYPYSYRISLRQGPTSEALARECLEFIVMPSPQPAENQSRTLPFAAESCPPPEIRRTPRLPWCR